MNRRTFLKRSLGYGLSVGATLTLGKFVWPSYASASDVSGDLEPQAARLQLHPSLDTTEVWSFAAGASPLLRYKQGEQVSLRVVNKLNEAVGVHWHGLRVPNAMDGVPNVTQAPIKSGETFDYDFALEDAGTYWYHTHSNSQEQLGRGLAGALIVEENRPPGVDEDLVLLLQDWRLGNNAQVQNDFYNHHDLAHEGRLGNAVSVNAEIQPSFTVRPGSRLRLRFINASTARLYRPALPGGWTAWTVALDGQPVPVSPYEATLLAPGMRADLIVDVPEAQPLATVTDTAYDPYPLFTFEASGEGRLPREAAPEALEPNPVALPSADAERLNLVLEGGAMSSMMGGMMGRSVWFLNGDAAKEGDTPTPMFVLEQGRSYRMSIDNQTAFPHPMHLHGHTFQVLNQNEQGLQPRLSDTALLLPQDRTDIAFVADNPGDWMLHCHVLGHQAGGMMALVKVV